MHKDAQRHPRGPSLPTQGLPPSLHRPQGRPGTHDATVPERGCSRLARRYRPILATVSLTLARFPEWGRRWGLCGWFDACLSRIPPLSESVEVAKMTPERAGPTAVMEHSPGVGGSPGRWGQGLGRLRVSRRSAGGPGASTLSGNRLQMTKMGGGKGGQGRRSPEDLRGRGARARGGRHKGGPGGGEGWRRGLAPLSPVCFGRASS